MAEEFYLWTPVANALEVYRRRILSEPDAIYEHIWRLIHVQESLVVTLGAAIASRLLDQWQNNPQVKDQLNELRSRVTGIQLDGMVQTESCLGGSIEAWVQLLERFGKPDTLPGCPFSSSLGKYLCEGQEGKLCFLDAWKRIAPVPAGTDRDGLSRVERFRAINQLRNKLAHVPLPTRLLTELHKGLRMEVLTALSPKYNSSKDNPSEDFCERTMHEPLRGRLLSRGFFCTGSFVRGKREQEDLTTEIVRLQPEVNVDDEKLSWAGDPFFSVDAECKVSLLFRIRSDMDISSDFFTAEYHRFAAEFEPVNSRDIDGKVMRPWLEFSPTDSTKVSASGDGKKEEGEFKPGHGEEARGVSVEAQDPDVLRSIAEEAYQRRQYAKAIPAFEKLADTGDNRYNDVAKLHHGKLLWRHGYENSESPTDQRLEVIKKAVELLKEASTHVDARYSAQAWYEMSKAYHKLWKLNGDGYFDEAYKAAEEAAKLDYQIAYITWIERLDDEKRRYE